MISPSLFKDAEMLFQGDRFTDTDRLSSPHGLGWGYAQLIAARLQVAYPQMQLTIQNRGVSGDRLKDMAARWQADCISLQPDNLSMLIGIIDTWRIFDQQEPSPIRIYESRYRTLLDQVKKGTRAKLVLCEPFVLPDPPDRKAWRADLDERIAVTRKLASEYQSVLVPFDQLFRQAAEKAPCTTWLHDGVHPTLAGHQYMADMWLKVVPADSQ